MGRRIVSALLVVAMLLTGADFTAVAAEVQDVAETQSEALEIESTEEEPEAEESAAESVEDKQEMTTESEEESSISLPAEDTEESGTESEGSLQEESSLETEDTEETETGFESKEDDVEDSDEEIVNAVEEVIEDSGKCGDNLTWNLEGETLTISGTGEMYSYVVPGAYFYEKSSAPWNNHISIKKLVIEKGITKIGSYAFSRLNSIEGDLVIPDSVTLIEHGAFGGCSGFTGKLTIPDSVTAIGQHAFGGCSGFTGNLTISDSVTEIGACAFVDCSGFTGKLTIPDSVTKIGEAAFGHCSGFTGTLTIPDSVTEIGEYAFYACSGFTGNLTIPDSVTGIGAYAFGDCSGFTGKLTIPDSVTEIGNMAFNRCSGFTGNLTIPDSVTVIGQYAFEDCRGFTGTLTIPDSVTKIGAYAFDGCRGFTGTLTIPDSMTIIEERAFRDCRGFTGDLTIPDGVTLIEHGAFGGCSGFTGNLTIPDSVTEIGWSAFEGCSGLSGKVYIPSNVIAIGSDAFCRIPDCTIYGVPGSYAETYAKENGIPFVPYNMDGPETGEVLDSSSDEEIIAEVTKYTSNDIFAQWEAIINSGYGNEEKLRRLNELSHNYGLTDIKEGIQYVSEVSSHRRDYLYLTTNENYCAFNWWYWLNTSIKGKIARGLLYADGLIFNFELSTYMDWSTYVNNTYPGVEKCKTMLKDFMEVKDSESLITNVADESKRLSKDLKNAVKLNNIAMNAELEEIMDHVIEAKTPELRDKYQKQFAKFLVNQAKIQQKVETDGEVKLYLGADSLAKALGYTTKIISFTGSTVNDIVDMMNLENDIEKYEEYDRFLTTIYSEAAVSKEMRIAAFQLHDEIKNGYLNKIQSIVSNFIRFTENMIYMDKSLLNTYLESKGLSTATTDLLGEALGTISLATVISNIIIDTGDFVKQAAYTMSYAELATLYSLKLQSDREAFRADPSAANAWQFYEDYNLLWRLRYKGEEQYLKMNKVKVFIFAKIKTLGYSYKENVVKDILSSLESCIFELAEGVSVPKSVQYVKKTVIKCPVDVLVYTQDGIQVADLKDGRLSDSTNEYGRFAVMYESYSGEYAKVICQSTDQELVIKMTAVGDGLVDYESTRTGCDEVLAFYSELVEKDDVITVDGNQYRINRNGGETDGTGKQLNSIGQEYVKAESIVADQSSITLVNGESVTVKVSVLPNNATNKDVIWYSEDEDIVSVKNSVLTANALGESVIWAKSCDNDDIEISIAVKVVNAIIPETFNVFWDVQGGGGIEPVTEVIAGNTTVLPVPVRSGYMFCGWYTEPEGKGELFTDRTPVMKDITLYACWVPEKEIPEGLWIEDVPAQIYTGKAIKPHIVVYDGATLLQEKVDYTVSYKNNTKANDASNEKTAPTITVTGKGNYSGKETATFVIQPKDISESAADISAADITVKETGKVQKPVPVVQWGKKKLKNKTEFTVEYPDTTEGAYQKAGTYKIFVRGKGNYTGERTVMLTITANHLLSKATVSKIANQTYTGSNIEPALTVKYGKAVLTKGTDYTVTYENNVEIGTATAVLKGVGNYSGEKRVTFKITGGSISKAKISGMIASTEYTGKEIVQKCSLTITANKETKELEENKDYTVAYQKNVNAGTATVVFTGINGYSGTLKKTFKITAYDLAKNSAGLVGVEEDQQSAYAKGGSKPKPTVTFDGKALQEGVDYKLTYKNNAVVNSSNPQKQPTVTITGKGNFKGAISKTFMIVQQDIGKLTLTAPDKVYQKKKNAWKSGITITDLDGKKLAAGKDYSKTLEYTYAEAVTLADGTERKTGDTVNASDILPQGTVVRVTATGRGNYSGTIAGIYRITKSDIGKTTVKVQTQTYTGQKIKPGKDQITVKIGRTVLGEKDYEIVSYSNNVKKGTATVVLRGVGDYGGIKTAKFTIKSKGFLWWWRN